jgi:hypothetical protein
VYGKDNNTAGARYCKLILCKPSSKTESLCCCLLRRIKLTTRATKTRCLIRGKSKTRQRKSFRCGDELPGEGIAFLNMPSHTAALTRLFRALDRDKDGYLLTSDLALLARVMLGRPVTEQEARAELQRVKLEAEARIGAKRTNQPDVLCLEEFLAKEVDLATVSEQHFEGVVQDYVEAINRITGTITNRELVVLRMARQQWRMAQEEHLNRKTEEPVVAVHLGEQRPPSPPTSAGATPT